MLLKDQLLLLEVRLLLLQDQVLPQESLHMPGQFLQLERKVDSGQLEYCGSYR